MKTFRITGTMSGTSLDGLDIACCEFTRSNGSKWSYTILAAGTMPYPPEWERRLQGMFHATGRELAAMHMEYGRYVGSQVLDFHRNRGISPPLLVASHGHTVFHQPEHGFTFQLGHGAAIAAAAQCNAATDFRSMDVALGGQGAPLVPAGDKLLFGEYDHCLNLGGFSNISFDRDGERRAFDICPVNIVINLLVRKARIPWSTCREAGDPPPGEQHLSYDPSGSIARSGKTDKALLDALNALPFYSHGGPKSLGYEWVEQHILPLLEKHPLPAEDVLHTWYEHVAGQIAASVRDNRPVNILVTGGGAHNTFLLECIREALGRSVHLHVPETLLTDFKEALVFAFLGLLCMLGEPNCLSGATGAARDAIGGTIHRYAG